MTPVFLQLRYRIFLLILPSPSLFLSAPLSPVSIVSLEALDVAVGLKAGQQDVEEPQHHEEQGSENAMASGSAKLSTNVATATVHEGQHSKYRKNAKERQREGERAGVHLEYTTMKPPIHGGHGPGHAQSHKHIHSVTACHVPNGRVRIHVLHCCHLTRKRV